MFSFVCEKLCSYDAVLLALLHFCLEFWLVACHKIASKESDQFSSAFCSLMSFVNPRFLQTSPMSVHGNSERYILIGKSSTKYYLEHSIIYSSDRTLDFPAQIYNVQPVKLEVNEEEMSIRHTIKASYVEGNVTFSLVFVTEFL